MRYLLQFITMLSDIVIMFMCAYVLYFMNFNVLSLVLVALTLWVYKEQEGFMAWKPKNIKAFMKNAKTLGL